MRSIKLIELPSLYKLPSVVIVDVRPKEEFEEGHIPGSINIPNSELKDRIKEIPLGKSVYTVCERGGQSIGAAFILARHGITASSVTSGGVKHWKEKGLPIISSK